MIKSTRSRCFLAGSKTSGVRLVGRCQSFSRALGIGTLITTNEAQVGCFLRKSTGLLCRRERACGSGQEPPSPPSPGRLAGLQAVQALAAGRCLMEVIMSNTELENAKVGEAQPGPKDRQTERRSASAAAKSRQPKRSSKPPTQVAGRFWFQEAAPSGAGRHQAGSGDPNAWTAIGREHRGHCRQDRLAAAFRSRVF